MKNKISSILGKIGIAIMILGGISAFILAGADPKMYSWVIAIGGLAGSILSGLMLMGFAELIELQQQVSDNSQIALSLSAPETKGLELKPGKYDVGSAIPKGRYMVYGSARFILKNEKGNIVTGGCLNETGGVCVLEQGQTIDNDATAYLIPLK